MPIAPAITFELATQGHFLQDRGQRAGFVLLVAFLLSFLFIRTSTRLIRKNVSWWPGNVTTGGGLHLHHLIWGILLMLLAGFLSFALDPSSPRTEILAALFGIGAGLTLDEFALWVHLRDVYWAEEGRASFDAVVVAAMTGGLILLGGVPLSLNSGGSIASLVLAVAIDVLFAVAAILKGKPVLGLIGLFVPMVSFVGAVRLASPNSPWARWRYKPGGHKLARAQARWARIDARRRRFSDAIAGAPTRGD